MSLILYLQIQHLYMHVRVYWGFLKLVVMFALFLHCYSDIINISSFLYLVLNMMTRIKKGVCLLQHPSGSEAEKAPNDGILLT